MTDYGLDTRLASFLLIAVRGEAIAAPGLKSSAMTQISLRQELASKLREHNMTLRQLVTELSPK